MEDLALVVRPEPAENTWTPATGPWPITKAELAPTILFDTVPTSRVSCGVEIARNWTPDGKAIIFQKFRANKSNENYTDIEVLDIQNGQVSILPGSEKLIGPTISPDRHWLAAAPSNRQEIMLFDFATRKWTELAKTDVGGISWTRDGKYLYFDFESGLDPAISRLPMADGKMERVTGLKDFRRFIFGFFPWSGLTPDGDPLRLRDVGTQEVYALDFQTE